MADDVHVRDIGWGEPTLLLLHGLGATGHVWDPWLATLITQWPGRLVAPDLPGHGASAPLPSYSIDDLADAVIAAVEPGAQTVIFGHSLGGAVGLAIANRRPVRGVVGLGIKVVWSEEDLQRTREVAARPILWFDSRDDAARRYLRVSGLADLVRFDDPVIDDGLRQQDGRWRLAMDPAVFGVGAPDMPSLLAGSQAEVVLARGEHDAMNTDEQLGALVPVAQTLRGLGHNAHVERPAACFTLLNPFR